MKRIAIDFDGVLCDPQNVEPGFKMGNPILGAQDSIRKLWAQGWYIIIFTVRGGLPKHVEEWLKFFDIPFNEVTNIKPNDVAFFVDDHALRFEGQWDETLAAIEFRHKEYMRTKGEK